MSNPSNIRINPFGGIKTYVNLTETHIIPSTSPFVIRLNEVPEKRSPSNIKCVYVNDTTGAATSGALTEVAATPAAGQFRPDYSTKADGNEEWNTGLLEFNSTDAGKIVQITYMGMGTLAAVQSNKYPSWYTDRGDGSDGDFIPSGNTTIGGVKNYKSVFIKGGITVNVSGYVRIKCQGSFVNLGHISANGQGAAGGKGGREGNNSNNYSGGNGVNGATVGSSISSGGAGGSGMVDTHGGAGGRKDHTALDMSYFDVMYGSGGGGGGGGNRATAGNGGAGGGDIVIVADSVKNKGTISANGTNGTNSTNGIVRGGGGGGGGGGRVIIFANAIEQGTVTVNGGAGGSGNANGAAGSAGLKVIKQLGVL